MQSELTKAANAFSRKYRAAHSSQSSAEVCAMDILYENRFGIGLMLIGAAFGFVTAILASHPTILWILAAVCFFSGAYLCLWQYLQTRSDSQIAFRLRDRVQRLLDKIGEEPKIKYQIPEKEWNERLQAWRTHKLKLVHTFRRRHLPQIQDFIHRLGEKGITDQPLNIMIDHDPQDYAAIKEIVDRLSTLGSRLRNKNPLS